MYFEDPQKYPPTYDYLSPNLAIFFVVTKHHIQAGATTAQAYFIGTFLSVLKIGLTRGSKICYKITGSIYLQLVVELMYSQGVQCCSKFVYCTWSYLLLFAILYLQTQQVDTLIHSIDYHQHAYAKGLEPMLSFMSKHGLPRDFPTDGSHFKALSSLPLCETQDTSEHEDNALEYSSFWLEKVCLPTVGIFGIIGNLSAIAVYKV